MKTYNLYIIIISWLLHHANRLGNTPYFYPVKNKILKKHGKFLCYDIQFIEGKKCHSCVGGIHHTIYDSYGMPSEKAICWNCAGTSWYKRPTWNILAKMKLGKYEFHQPYKRVYEKPDYGIQIFNGYIEHTPSKYSKFALNILFLLYDKEFLKRSYKERRDRYRRKYRRFVYTINNFSLTRKKLELETCDDLPF